MPHPSSHDVWDPQNLSRQFRPSGNIQGAQRNLGNLDFNSLRDPLSALAESIAGDFFGPGGSAERQTNQALRHSVDTGFGPRSGGFDAARLNILQNATTQASRGISAGAIQLFPQLLAQRESQFGAASTIENLRLAEEQQRQNQQALDQANNCSLGDRIGAGFSGAGTGALTGSMIGSPGGPVGPIAGALVGGLAGLGAGLFGGC